MDSQSQSREKERYLYELCLKGIGGEISPEEIKAAVNEYLEKNPVKPGATTEQAQQIEQNKTDVASLKTETGSLKEDLVELTLTERKKHINALNRDKILLNTNIVSAVGQDLILAHVVDKMSLSELIPCEPGETVCINTKYVSWYFYDSNKKMLSFKYVSNGATLTTIPENCYYITFCKDYNGANLPKYNIVFNGDVITDYVDYNVLNVQTKGEKTNADAIRYIESNIASYWKGKKILVLGDSTSATEEWQRQLVNELGVSVTTHAKGGIGLKEMVVGSLGYNGEYDNNTGNTGILQPLKTADVYNKDLIIIFGGFNNRGIAVGKVGDCLTYNDEGVITSGNTTAGCLQFVLNWVYNLLKGDATYSANLSCKIAVITPYCAGKYAYVDVDWYGHNPNGISGNDDTGHDLANIMVDVAHENNCSAWNAWEESGIGRYTWSIYSASPTPTNTDGSGGGTYPHNNDQLHLNNTVGYPYLGKQIAKFVDGLR